MSPTPTASRPSTSGPAAGGKTASRPGAGGPHPTSPVAATLIVVARRVGTALLTVLLASFFVFFAVQALPGDVAQQLLGQDATPDAVAALLDEIRSIQAAHPATIHPRPAEPFAPAD